MIQIPFEITANSYKTWSISSKAWDTCIQAVCDTFQGKGHQRTSTAELVHGSVHELLVLVVSALESRLPLLRMVQLAYYGYSQTSEELETRI